MAATGIKAAGLLYEYNVLLSSRFFWKLILSPVRLRPPLEKGGEVGEKESSQSNYFGQFGNNPTYTEKKGKLRGERM